MVLPTGKVAGASFVTEATLQLSSLTEVPKLTPDAVQIPESVFAVTLGGQIITGSSSSVMVILKEQLTLFPEASVAV